MIREYKLDVVFDCMTYLQAVAREGGPAFACLEAFENGAFTLHISPKILEEIRDVLTRPELQNKFAMLTPERVDALISRLKEKAVTTLNVPEEFKYRRDPKDEPYINLAIITRSQYLVSRDNDLLDLMDEKRADGRDFRHRYPHLTILDPVAFLNLLKND